MLDVLRITGKFLSVNRNVNRGHNVHAHICHGERNRSGSFRRQCREVNHNVVHFDRVAVVRMRVVKIRPAVGNFDSVRYSLAVLGRELI